MVLNKKTNSATRFIFYFHFAIFFSKIVRKLSRLSKSAQEVSIIRDNWGIAHVYGKTDADAVLMLYAQCEDDFKRVEMNYIEKLGRL
jgi:acyl-homoserine lactone acylase PvdQ